MGLVTETDEHGDSDPSVKPFFNKVCANINIPYDALNERMEKLEIGL